MARIAGVDLPKNKVAEIGLTAMKTSKKCYEFLGENLKKDEDILAILNEQ